MYTLWCGFICVSLLPSIAAAPQGLESSVLLLLSSYNPIPHCRLGTETWIAAQVHPGTSKRRSTAVRTWTHFTYTGRHKPMQQLRSRPLSELRKKKWITDVHSIPISPWRTCIDFFGTHVPTHKQTCYRRNKSKLGQQSAEAEGSSDLCVYVCLCVWKRKLQAESSKGFSLRLANEYVHFHLHCFFDNNDVPLGETKGAIDSRMCWASLQEVGREVALIALRGASRLHLIGQPIRRGVQFAS